MEKGDIEEQQYVAESRYADAHTGSMQEIGWQQNRLLAEVALQLVKMNEQLARIATAVEVLERR